MDGEYVIRRRAFFCVSLALCLIREPRAGVLTRTLLGVIVESDRGKSIKADFLIGVENGDNASSSSARDPDAPFRAATTLQYQTRGYLSLVGQTMTKARANRCPQMIDCHMFPQHIFSATNIP